MSLWQRKKIQKMLWRNDLDNSGGGAPVRHVHGMLRRLGRRHDLRPRDEAGRAVPLPRRGLLHYLRDAAAGSLPALRLRLARARQPVSGFVPARRARRDDRADKMAKTSGVHPEIAGTRPGRAPADVDKLATQ